MSSYFVHTMDVDKLINEGLEVEAKCLKFQQFWKDLTNTSDSLDNEISSMSEKLPRLNMEINNLQTKKNQLDKVKYTTETNVKIITTKMKQLDAIQIHLNALNQRKHILEEYSIEKGLKLEEKTLQEKLDNAWRYNSGKNSKLDEEINNLELKLSNRQNMISKMNEKECNKYKKSIERLKNENNILEKKLILISKLQDYS